MFSGIIGIEHGLEMGKSKPSSKAALIQTKNISKSNFKATQYVSIIRSQGKTHQTQV